MLKNFLSRYLLGDKAKQMGMVTKMLIEGYERLPAAMRKPENILDSLKEVDPQYLEFLQRLISQQNIYPQTNDDVSRTLSVQESRSLYTYDVITQNVIDLWTDYGFGSKTEVNSAETEDEVPQDLLDAFFDSPANQYVLGQRQISNLSTTLLVDGEFFFVFFISKTDATVILRVIPTEQIKDIVCDKDDASVPLFYYREWIPSGTAIPSKLLYRDWRADAKAIARVDTSKKYSDVEKAEDASNAQAVENAGKAGEVIELNEVATVGTEIVMMHIAYRNLNLRGYPLMTAGAAWSRAYKNFLQDRAAVSRSMAMFVDKLTVNGGSLAVDAVRRALESSLTYRNDEVNPAAVPGSTFVQNKTMDLQRMPMGTGAGDAEKDGAPLLAQAGLAGRIFPHYLGRGEAFRLATATAMEQPVLRAFNRYRRFWDSIWQDIATIVFNAAEKYASKKIVEKNVVIVSDPLIQMDTEQISTFTTAVCDLYDRGSILPEQMTAVTEIILSAGLHALGTTDVTSVLAPDTETAEEGVGKGKKKKKTRSTIEDTAVSEFDKSEEGKIFNKTMRDAIKKSWKEEGNE
jgi:hypothetical protein